MKYSVLSFFAGLSLVFLSCQGPTHHHHGPAHGTHPALYATLYQQQSAEYKALCYQAFNIADMRLNERLATEIEKPLAIVVDIDETVLDNSPYQAQGILDHFGYPEKWDTWVNSATAEVVPGALEFLTAASEQGVEVFYIPNRKEVFRDATRKNLLDLGFPDAVDENILLRTDENDKEPRRQKVMQNHEIFLLMGDNLGDFHSVFDGDNAQTREKFMLENLEKLGKTWIVLPNPLYGTWMNALPGIKEAREHKDDAYLEKGLKGF
ncbi:MAG: 5'-nucleotidase, lipoprotein e(P4) family [Bacteroidales bacterium]|nr:5'-nucleotidase, lipoprotein e(P4) family [Bacteroidales bacterium]